MSGAEAVGERSCSVRAIICGSMRGSLGTIHYGGPMSLRPPCGPGPGGAERWPNMASAQASSITAGPSPDLTVRWSVSLAAVLESCS